MSHITPPPDIPGPRNPRIHRQSDIPSISRPRGGTPSPNPDNFDDAVTPKPSNVRHNKTSIGKTNTVKKAKALGFQFLSKNRGGEGGQETVQDPDKLFSHGHPSASSSTPSGPERRVASMPPSSLHQGQLQAHLNVGNTRCGGGIGLASPPIVDFTRFEDMYRSPRNGAFEGLISSHRTSKPKSHIGLGGAGSGGRSGSQGNNWSSSAVNGMKSGPKTDTPVPLVLERRTTTARFSVPGCGGGGTASGLVEPPQPASERKPDPRLIFSAVADILGSQTQVAEYLNAHELLATHQLDQLDFEERDAVHAGFLESGRLKVKGRKGSLVVLGEPLRRTTLYSSSTMVLGGRDHILPILVINCVEELYRTGIYQPQLFRTLPNRTRLLELIKIFDSEHAIPGSVIRSRQPKGSVHAHTILIPNAGFGTNTSLHLESTPDICALLTTYLSSLPEPVLPPFLFKAIWDWCGLDDDDDAEYDDNAEEERHANGHGTSGNLKPSSSSSFSRYPGLPSPIPLSKTYTSPAESTRILLAQLLLHLMPSPNFSLLIYLLAFFSQVVLVREENGVGVDDLSRMFGGRIFGGSSIPSSESSAPLCASGSTSSAKRGASVQAANSSGCTTNDDDVFNLTQTRREGETMMAWFMRRWAPISEGLFDVVDDAKMGLFRRTMARKDSLGQDVLSGWLSGSVGTPTGRRTGDGRPVVDNVDTDIERYDGHTEDKRENDDREEELAVISPDVELHPSTRKPPSIRVDMAPQGHSTPNSKARTRKENWLHTRTSYTRSEYDDDNDGNGEEMDERAHLAEDSDQEEIDIVDDYILLSSTTTPTPAAMTSMKSTPLEIDDTLDIVRISSSPMIRVSSRSGNDVSPCDERLMDISLPNFLNQTLSNQHEIDPKHLQSRDSTIRNLRDVGVQARPITPLIYQPDNDHEDAPSDHRYKQQQQQQQLAQALESVSHLERQLRNCTDLVSDTLKELDVSRRESYVRARRIVELEKALAQGGDTSTVSSSSGKGKGYFDDSGEGSDIGQRNGVHDAHGGMEAGIAGRTSSRGDDGVTNEVPVGIERN